MEEVSVQINESRSMDKTATVVVDIESLSLPSERCLGSPKFTRALSRKWSYRADKLSCNEAEDVGDQSSKRTTLVRVNSQLEHLKQPLMNNKALPNAAAAANLNSSCSNSTSSLLDSAEGKYKRFNRFTSINPRRILLFFATL
ncbi:hypothetical protein LguiA_031436 [Lonicera macranthoides]